MKPEFRRGPRRRSIRLYVRTATGAPVPLCAFVHQTTTTAPLAINHQGQFPAVTISFNVARGRVARRRGRRRSRPRRREIGLPPGVHADFAGTAQAFRESLASEPVLILAALITVYIVLGVLYESYIHPITILSTLPSAGVGALLALIVCRTEFSVIALIGIILLIGIVKKNAIMMIDFALEAEREQGHDARGVDPPGVPPPLPADHDDDDGGAPRRAAARARDGHGLGAAPAARHHDRRRPHHLAGAHALHDAGHLPLHGRASAGGSRAAPRSRRRVAGAGAQ